MLNGYCGDVSMGCDIAGRTGCAEQVANDGPMLTGCKNEPPVWLVDAPVQQLYRPLKSQRVCEVRWPQINCTVWTVYFGVAMLTG